MKKLQNANPEDVVEVSIHQSDKSYPVLYCEIFDNGYDHLQTDGTSHRIEVDLPDDNEKYTVLVERRK